MAVVLFFLNLANGHGLAMFALGFVRVAILFGVLQIGGDKKAWKYL